MSNQNGGTTQQLERTLKRKDLLSIAVGQIIGSGVMVMSISALKMTGRGIPFAFLLSAMFVLVQIIPIILVGSVVRLRGGQYSQVAVLVGEKFSGFYIVTYIFSNIALSMYAIGFVDYLLRLVPSVESYSKIIATCVLAFFFVLNFFGLKWFAKVQNIMFIMLTAALCLFIVTGLPNVQWGGYFTNTLFGEKFLSDGLIGFLEATAYLNFATAGANTIINFSGECVNPQKDIPFVIIVATVGVAVVYCVMGFCIAGIMPSSEVIAAGNLAVIAEGIMSKPMYLFFVICGALFAIGTTLNSTIGWVTKPLMQACDDGWLPKSMATLHPKFKTPYKLQIIFFIVNLFPIWIGLDIASLGKMVSLITKVILVILILSVLKMPKMWPEAWKKSIFYVSDKTLKLLVSFAMLAQVVQIALSLRNLKLEIVIFNLIMLVAAALFAHLRFKTGKVNVEPSYELK